MGKLKLPTAPEECSGSVKAWSEPVEIETYEPMTPDPNPMFLESRVYQGSSGKVYPLSFIDRIASEAKPRQWRAIHLENEFVRLMILPEIGGRIHVGLDKINGYDFFYRQNVIKPALVGLAGPWISGGVEFNWPQHHRPATFMPVNTEIERHPDGSVTVWCSDHDPMQRMRGTHGVCLHPGRSLVEVKVRLFNRTPLTQTFLWWANVATRVNEDYQSLFPPDVHFVADHARRAMATFPLCTGSYYGIDYGSRSEEGVPLEQQPTKFIPGGDYAPNDLSRYANIPVPTSYMAVGSNYDFLGGYDHGRQAGVVHVADHHISPGKKQWTWGNHEFGYAWDRNLTESDGPYIELMAGVYTDNQPDFSFIGPFETKTFSQYWFPIREISGIRQANQDAAVARKQVGEVIEFEVVVTRRYEGAKIQVRSTRSGAIAEWFEDLTPEKTLRRSVATVDGATLIVSAQDGSEIIRCEPPGDEQVSALEVATEPPMPEEIRSQEELYLTGMHLQQYRHATRHAKLYWQEALRREPLDYRCNTAMGQFHLRRGEFRKAEDHLRVAIATFTRRNQNPPDGEPFYLLGITLRYMGETEAAYSALYKATWNVAWKAAGYLALAEIDASRKRFGKALDHVSQALTYGADNLNARNLKALVLRKLGRNHESDSLLRESLEIDPLDAWTRHIRGQALQFPNQQLLDVAFDYARSGFLDEAVATLRSCELSASDGSVPVILYALSRFLETTGDEGAAREAQSRAMSASPRYCFPSRLEEQILLQNHLEQRPDDGLAHYYLGNLLYDKARHEEALGHWGKAAELLRSDLATVWRNLGVGYFNIRHDETKALDGFERAFAADQSDARVFFERDQLWKRTGTALSKRLVELERFPELVSRRDDLSVELATLYNQTGQPSRALALLRSRQFQPWEGGEGLAIAQYVRASIALGRDALRRLDCGAAIDHFREALAIPLNLGEAKHPLANESNIFYWLGAASEAAGQHCEATGWWHHAAAKQGDFQQMAVQPYSEMTIYSALSWIQLGEIAKARQMAAELAAYAERMMTQTARIDYFATSLPTMLIFRDDLQKRQKTNAAVLEAQAALINGDSDKASDGLKRILGTEPSHEVAFDTLQELPFFGQQANA